MRLSDQLYDWSNDEHAVYINDDERIFEWSDTGLHFTRVIELMVPDPEQEGEWKTVTHNLRVIERGTSYPEVWVDGILVVLDNKILNEGKYTEVTKEITSQPLQTYNDLLDFLIDSSTYDRVKCELNGRAIQVSANASGPCVTEERSDVEISLHQQKLAALIHGSIRDRLNLPPE